MVARDRPVSDQPDAHRAGCRLSRREEQQTVDELLEIGVRVCRWRVPKPKLDETAAADGAFVGDNLLCELPAGAQQDRSVCWRAFRQIQLIVENELGPQTRSDRMRRLGPDDELGEGTRAAWHPARELSERSIRVPCRQGA